MVNEAREALIAFVGGRDLINTDYKIEIVNEKFYLWRTCSEVDTTTDVVMFYDQETGLQLYREDLCMHRAKRCCAIDVLREYIGDPPDDIENESFRQWAGPLTWLALKAALTTGGNDEP